LRHNPGRLAPSSIMLRTLKMHGMAQAVRRADRTGLPSLREARAAEFLSQLRERRRQAGQGKCASTAYQLKAGPASPSYRDLTGFRLRQQRGSNEGAPRVNCHRLRVPGRRSPMSSLVGGPGNRARRISPPRIGVQAHRAPSQMRVPPSSPPSNSSTLLNKRKLSGAKPGQNRRPASPTPISSSSTSLATCRFSGLPAEPCLFHLPEQSSIEARQRHHHHQSQPSGEWATVFGDPKDDDRGYSIVSTHRWPHPRNRKTTDSVFKNSSANRHQNPQKGGKPRNLTKRLTSKTIIKPGSVLNGNPGSVLAGKSTTSHSPKAFAKRV